MFEPIQFDRPTARSVILASILWSFSVVGMAQVPITYQGQLKQSGTPHSGSVDMAFAFYNTVTGGSTQLIVPKPNVPVEEGLFQVELDASSLDFSQTWYVEARIEGIALSPRQRVTAAPIALYALNAPGGGAGYDNFIVVAKSGGHFDSVAAALDSITTPSESNRYLVWVAPGEYLENDPVDVPEFVHLKGAGPTTTVISSARAASAPNNAAATVVLQENSRLSDLSIENTGGGPLSIAVYSAETSRETVIDNVKAEASGSGTGGGRYALYLNDAEPTVRNSYFKASGATGSSTAVNAGMGSVNIAGGFPQALILDSIFLGGATATVESCTDGSGTGFGMQLSQSSPDVRNSHICGGHRGVSLFQSGNPRFQHTELRVSSTFGAFLFEISSGGSISVAHSAIAYFGNKFTGTGAGLRCVHNHAFGTWTPLSNGTTTSTSCN